MLQKVDKNGEQKASKPAITNYYTKNGCRPIRNAPIQYDADSRNTRIRDTLIRASNRYIRILAFRKLYLRLSYIGQLLQVG